MRALTMEELSFVSGGSEALAWDNYQTPTKPKDPAREKGRGPTDAERDQWMFNTVDSILKAAVAGAVVGCIGTILAGCIMGAGAGAAAGGATAAVTAALSPPKAQTR